MDGHKPSRTAQAVTAERAVLADMGVIVDPQAQLMLTRSMAGIRTMVKLLPYRVRAKSVTLAGLAARVLWFDSQVLRALEGGVTQVVVIGAGYDSRAWRLRRDDVRFFELDHPTTQQDKKRRAPGLGPIYIAADLRADDVGRALQREGLDPGRPSLFILEGVTMYLEKDVVGRRLGDLAKLSPVGSRLLVDFLPPRGAGASLNRRQDRLQRLARAAGDEGYLLRLDRPEALRLITDSGWALEEVLSLRDAGRSLVPPRSGLRIEDVNEHKSLVAAVLPGKTSPALAR